MRKNKNNNARNVIYKILKMINNHKEKIKKISNIVDVTMNYYGIPIKINKIFAFSKTLYNKIMQEKWDNFLLYAEIDAEFLKEVENNKDILNYLYDYFETIRKTPSILAIKTMALIFKDYKNDKIILQRTCRDFSEIVDIELDIFIKLYEKSEKISSMTESVYKLFMDFSERGKYRELKDDKLNYYITNLSNRGFLYVKENTGFMTGDSDFDFNFCIKFNSVSEIYYKYILKAKEINNNLVTNN